jgi:hypothetical protein
MLTLVSVAPCDSASHLSVLAYGLPFDLTGAKSGNGSIDTAEIASHIAARRSNGKTDLDRRERRGCRYKIGRGYPPARQLVLSASG